MTSATDAEGGAGTVSSTVHNNTQVFKLSLKDAFCSICLSFFFAKIAKLCKRLRFFFLLATQQQEEKKREKKGCVPVKG